MYKVSESNRITALQDLEKTRQHVSALQQQVNSHAASVEELQKAKQVASSQCVLLEHQFSQLLLKWQDGTETINKLLLQIETLSNSNNSCSRDLQVVQAEKQTLSNQVESIRQENKSLLTTIEALTQQLQLVTADKSHVEEELVALKTAFADLEKDLQDARENSLVMLDTRDSQITNWQLACQKYSDELNIASQQCLVEVEKHRELKEVMEEMEETYEAKVAALQEQIDEKEAHNKTFIQQINLYKTQRTQYHSVIDKMRSYCARMKAELVILRKDVVAMAHFHKLILRYGIYK
ncbi:hypothetical protein EON65_29805 [archaeon]|nr:MAG: hypothetical protein EON65_29805 [archaeon]